MKTYKTFVRSCTNFREFASARKITKRTRLSEAEARAMCKDFNDRRNSRQMQAGTKMEYEAE